MMPGWIDKVPRPAAIPLIVSCSVTEELDKSGTVIDLIRRTSFVENCMVAKGYLVN